MEWNNKPSVFIKAKEGRAAYMRDDPRLKRALKAFRHTIRAQTPMDEKINEDFGPYPKRPAEDITLIQINSEGSDEEIDQEPTPTVPLEVTLSNFIVRPQLLGNMSGDEEGYEEDGTPLLVKIEQKSDDSDDENNPENDNEGPKMQILTEKTQADPMEPTEIETANSYTGASDSSSSEDDEPPTEEAVDEARKKVAFEFFKEFVADHRTATALIQALRKSKFAFPVGQGVTKKCGEDFITTEIPKTAKVRKLRIKGKGKGVGKKSNKDRGTARHDSAQDQKAGEMRDAAQEQDVLDGEISKAETENLYADNNNKSKAGPSGQRREKNEERGCKKEKVEKVEKGTDKTNGKPDRKRRSSPKQGRINFFQEKGTPNAKLAEQENIAPLSWCKDSQANT